MARFRPSSVLLILSLQYFIIHIQAISNEIFFDNDKQYDVMEIKVSNELWRHAFYPTPVLKSPVTIVVPIHVAPEDQVLFDGEEDNIATEETLVENSTIVSDQEEIDGGVTINNDTISDSTENPLEDNLVSSTTAPQQVTGSLVRFPCSCLSGQCGCCTGAILERFKTKACGNITFIPEDFIFDVRMSINDNTVVRRRVSASNPPPICFNPRRAPFVQVCAEISNIRIRNRNAFACLDINADIGGFPVYSASFRCFGLGTSGVQTGLKPKPVSSGPAPVSLFGNTNDDDDDDDDGGLIGNLGDGDGIFGSDGGSDNDGPLDAIGDVVGDFF